MAGYGAVLGVIGGGGEEGDWAFFRGLKKGRRTKWSVKKKIRKQAAWQLPCAVLEIVARKGGGGCS